ncbi:MAG: hypothetical protein ACI9U2_005204 [Bradymonadia bacterium]|jgi:hypothetical protein
MLRRLITYALMGAIVGALYKLFTSGKQRRLPGMPRGWHELAEHDVVAREAIEVGQRLQRLLEDEEIDLQHTLSTDVHAIIETIVGLVTTRREVETYIDELGAHPAGRRKGRPMPGQAQRQREETRTALEARADRLAEESQQAVAGLRAVYFEMLQTLEAGGSGGQLAIERTRGLVDDLRAHAKAEVEIRNMLGTDRDRT